MNTVSGHLSIDSIIFVALEFFEETSALALATGIAPIKDGPAKISTSPRFVMAALRLLPIQKQP